MRLQSALMMVLLATAGCGRDDTSGALEQGGEVDLRAATAARLQGDPLAARADSLVRAGRAWRASALLAPRLTNPSSAAPEVRLAGARAAAEWEGWMEVDRVLRGAPWLDTQFAGEGRELLARSALERGVDALADTRAALENSRESASRVTRGVLVARAYDRAGQRDSAAAYYLSAASRLPRLADWLRLRAVGVTSDSAARARLVAAVRSTPAKARIAATDAQARERSGDLSGAAQGFRTAGDEGSAFRVEALAARDDASRAAVSQRIVAFLARSTKPAESRQVLEVLDKLGSLPPGAELPVARAALGAGANSRAVSGFARAAATTPLSAPDRMSWGNALARAGRAAEAARTYATVSDDPALAPLAAYQRARMLAQSGDGTGARSALRTVATQFANSRAAAAPALLLLADLQVDDADIAAATSSLRDLLQRYPEASQAPLGMFRLALLEWPTAAAAQTFDSLVARYPGNEEANAARYWAGRTYEKLGRAADARARWTTLIETSPLSYYGVVATERLQAGAWVPPSGADTAAHIASVDSAVERIRGLRQLGMDVEARFEIEALAERAAHTPVDAPAVAQALTAIGEPARALRLALATVEHGTASRSMLLAAYPVVHEDALVEESRRNRLDPALVAGLIRQESSWNPRAVSPATARGLMQLMPSVGASIATARRYPIWNPALLFEPDVSLELGTAHLSTSLRGDTPVQRALAAYNAGASRVARWSQRPGADDPELFTELIPFTETRDYVRLVVRNAAVYRALYGLK